MKNNGGWSDFEIEEAKFHANANGFIIHYYDEKNNFLKAYVTGLDEDEAVDRFWDESVEQGQDCSLCDITNITKGVMPGFYLR